MLVLRQIKMIQKQFYTFFIAFFLLLGSWNVLIAQDINAKWAIKASYNIIQYTGELENQFLNPNTRNDGFGIGFSHYLNPSLDVQIGLNYNKLLLNGTIDTTFYSRSGSLFSSGIALHYKLANDYILPATARFRPYVGVGFNHLAGKTSGNAYDISNGELKHAIDEVEFNLVGGVKYVVTKRVSAFVEYSEHFATADEWDGAFIDFKNDKLRGFQLGLVVKLGREKDSDGDGVPDKDDECPDTPRGVEVDEKGCPKDRDKDGIPDFEDDCPDDPGLPEFNGCPDRDGDGIPDKIDDCPDIPGLEEFNGCPDTDGDGVPDPKDHCPDTPAGVKVDDYGCPIDSDGDGLTDDIDQCPDEYGPMEYMGCPEPPDPGWPDIPKETPPEVYFDTDKAELTPEAEAELNKMVRHLFENPNFSIRLFGFADPRGSVEYNQKLSERRVDAVKKYLMRRGIPESRIIVRALGEIQEVEGSHEGESQDEQYRRARKVEFQTFFLFR